MPCEGRSWRCYPNKWVRESVDAVILLPQGIPILTGMHAEKGAGLEIIGNTVTLRVRFSRKVGKWIGWGAKAMIKTIFSGVSSISRCRAFGRKHFKESIGFMGWIVLFPGGAAERRFTPCLS